MEIVVFRGGNLGVQQETTSVPRRTTRVPRRRSRRPNQNGVMSNETSLGNEKIWKMREFSHAKKNINDPDIMGNQKSQWEDSLSALSDKLPTGQVESDWPHISMKPCDSVLQKSSKKFLNPSLRIEENWAIQPLVCACCSFLFFSPA